MQDDVHRTTDSDRSCDCGHGDSRGRDASQRRHRGVHRRPQWRPPSWSRCGGRASGRHPSGHDDDYRSGRLLSGIGAASWRICRPFRPGRIRPDGASRSHRSGSHGDAVSHTRDRSDERAGAGDRAGGHARRVDLRADRQFFQRDVERAADLVSKLHTRHRRRSRRERAAPR